MQSKFVDVAGTILVAKWSNDIVYIECASNTKLSRHYYFIQDIFVRHSHGN